MNTWITSDWHCGEDRFEIMSRPFTTVDEHINYLITQHNNLVDPNDEVFVVGDAVYQKAPQYLPYIQKFNGKKTLIRGNHDVVFSDEQLKPYFTTIIKEGDGMEIDIEGIPCYITHYPTQGRENRFNLVGHVHGAFKYQLNMMNIGVDCNHFRPHNIKSIPFHYTAICKYYDRDVFAAYSKINFAYIDERSRKDTYFKRENK